MSIPVGFMANNMPLVNSVFDSAAGPSLLREEVLKPAWMKHIQTNNQSHLEDATCRKVSVVEKLQLHVKISDSRGKVIFGTVRRRSTLSECYRYMSE